MGEFAIKVDNDATISVANSPEEDGKVYADLDGGEHVSLLYDGTEVASLHLDEGNCPDLRDGDGYDYGDAVSRGRYTTGYRFEGRVFDDGRVSQALAYLAEVLESPDPAEDYGAEGWGDILIMALAGDFGREMEGYVDIHDTSSLPRIFDKET